MSELGLKRVLILLPGYPTLITRRVPGYSFFCFDDIMAGEHVLRSTISRPTVMTTDVTLQHTSRPSLLLSLHCKAMIVFFKHRIHLESLRREIMSCVPSEKGQCQDKRTFSFVCFVLFINVKYTKYPG